MKEKRLREVVWVLWVLLVCAALVLCIGTWYEKRIVELLPQRATPFVTPTLDWPTPVSTNTPRPTRTPTPTPTPPLRLPLSEIDTVAALTAYEALSESLRGQTAVAYTLLHLSLCQGKLPSEVLTAGFFGTEAGAEHLANMKEWWKPDNPEIGFDLWQQITLVAINTVNGWSHDEYPTSTHFYSTCLLKEPPTWTTDLKLLGCIGCHCFYGPKGG